MNLNALSKGDWKPLKGFKQESEMLFAFFKD